MHNTEEYKKLILKVEKANKNKRENTKMLINKLKHVNPLLAKEIENNLKETK